MTVVSRPMISRLKVIRVVTRLYTWMVHNIDFGRSPNNEKPYSECINWPDTLSASPATVVFFLVLLLQVTSFLVLLFWGWWSMNAVLDVNFVRKVLGRCVNKHFENPRN